MNNEELDDERLLQTLQGSPELQLVLVPFQEDDLDEKLEELEDAAGQGLSEKVEQILKLPIHPDDDSRHAEVFEKGGDNGGKPRKKMKCREARSALAAAVNTGQDETLG